MSGAFEDVILIWNGREYTIPARNMLRAVAIIEDHVTMMELQKFGMRETVPLARLSGAFAGVLTFAGCPKVTAETVYASMFDGDDKAQAVSTAITTLMSMMLPKSAREKLSTMGAGGDVAPGNSTPAASGNASSRKRTSSRSDQTGSRRRNSGTVRPKKSIG